MGVISDLQKRIIQGPTTRAFSPQAWLELAHRPDCSPDDTQVIAIGMLIHHALNKIRENLKCVNLEDVSANIKRRALVGLANRECLLSEIVVQEKAIISAARDSGVYVDQLASLKIDLPNGEFSPDEICQTVVDGMGRLLRMCSGPGSEGLKESVRPPVEDVIRDANLANAYINLEDLWLDVVWNGVRFVPGTRPMAFSAQDVTDESAQVVAQHRHQVTTAQVFNLAFLRIGQAAVDGELLTTFVYKQIDVSVDEGKVELALIDANSDVLARLAAVYTAAVPPYYEPVMTCQAPNGSVLTIKSILDAYLLLGSLAQGLANSSIDDLKRERSGDDGFVVELTSLAPLVSLHEIRPALELGLGVSEEMAQSLLNFLTFDGMESASDGGLPSELWSSPLVRVSDKHVAVCLFPLRSANFRWLIDVWLRRLGFPLDFRGAQFELFARQSITESIQESRLREVSQICDREFKFTPEGGREEEVDLLAVIGNKVIIGEAKCFLEPVEPIDRFNHQKKVRDAVAQISRKAAAVQSDPDGFRDRSKRCGISIPDGFDVLPVVVLNHALGAGQLIDGVPVVDLRIMEMFFEGYMQRMAVLSPGGNIEASQVDEFYSCVQDAQQKLESYLHDPPQVRHLKTAIRPRSTEFLMPGLEGDIAVRRQAQIDPDVFLSPFLGSEATSTESKS